VDKCENQEHHSENLLGAGGRSDCRQIPSLAAEPVSYWLQPPDEENFFSPPSYLQMFFLIYFVFIYV
jgi:hypothetical protein